MRTVFITGANRGIGLELTKQYIASGDTVHACCRRPGGAAELKELEKARRIVAMHQSPRLCEPEDVNLLEQAIRRRTSP